MARGITEDEVWKACDALLLEGARPTIERVRQKIGRGSPNTVSPMLETWFKHLGARISDPGTFAAPSTVPDPVRQAAQHFWEVAQAEARQDFNERLRDGLEAAIANVEAEKEKATIAEADAYAASSRSVDLQAELDGLRAGFDAERMSHQSTRAQLDGAQQRLADLQTELITARQAISEERARADQAIKVADDRAAGAERRAAMEIERERMLRIKEEKATVAMAKRFEAALKDQISATEQLNAVEDRHSRFQVYAREREQELHGGIGRLDSRVRELEDALTEAHSILSRSAAPEALVDQIVAKLGPVIEQSGKHNPTSMGQARKRKKTAA